MVEFVDGDIKIYEGQDIPVLTNDPTFPAMNAINDYWKAIGRRQFPARPCEQPRPFRAWLLLR